jgi:predicted nucleotidyltransferase
MRIRHGELPDSYIECFEKLNTASKDVGLEYMLIGATARDLVIEHVYGITPIRRTYDIDISLYVNSWEKFDEFKKALGEADFIPNLKTAHKMSFSPSNSEEVLQLDLVPFGPISDVQGDISWPPNFDFKMSVLGFDEAFKSKLLVDTNKETVIPVVSIEGLFLLKLIAWLDRGYNLRKKDAQDLGFVMDNYEHLDGMIDTLIDEDCAEDYDFDLTKIAAAKLGREIKSICSDQTHKYISTSLLAGDKQDTLEQLANEMSRNPEHNLTQLLIFKEIFRS